MWDSVAGDHFFAQVSRAKPDDHARIKLFTALRPGQISFQVEERLETRRVSEEQRDSSPAGVLIQLVQRIQRIGNANYRFPRATSPRQGPQLALSAH